MVEFFQSILPSRMTKPVALAFVKLIVEFNGRFALAGN